MSKICADDIPHADIERHFERRRNGVKDEEAE